MSLPSCVQCVTLLYSNKFQKLHEYLSAYYTVTDHKLIVCVLRSAKVKLKVIQLEGFVCVIYLPPSICSGDIVLVTIFSRFHQILTD